MSWMAQDSDESYSAPRRQGAHPNARANAGCPWAQDSDTDQFRRGPPSRNSQPQGNPINHTGYEQAPPPSRSSKKTNGGGGRGCPWALEEKPANHFAAPANAIGAGLLGASARTGGFAMQQSAVPRGEAESDYYHQGGSVPQYAVPIDDDDDEGYYDMPPPPQHRDSRPTNNKNVGGGCPWAQTDQTPMQSESRGAFSGQHDVPREQQVLKPRQSAPKINNENYNLLHDSTGSHGGFQYERDAQVKMQRDQLMQGSHQAVHDSRMAAQMIKNKMRLGENVISWQ